jgi:hypothetical protein
MMGRYAVSDAAAAVEAMTQGELGAVVDYLDGSACVKAAAALSPLSAQPLQNIAKDCMSQSYIAANRRERAAQLIAEGESTDREIAAALGVNAVTVWRWRQEPEIIERVGSIQQCLEDLTKRFMLARRSVRLGRLCEMHDSLQRIVEERSVEPDMQKAPGGDTGALVRRLRKIGRGKSAQTVEEFEFDAALFKEMREILKQIAQECGQWTDKKITGADCAPWSCRSSRSDTMATARLMERVRLSPASKSSSSSRSRSVSESSLNRD